MRSRPSTWFVISLLLFAASFALWRYGDRQLALRRAAASHRQPAPAAAAPAGALTKVSNGASARKSYRLSNTLAQGPALLHSPHALILRNAIIDTSRPLNLDIPAQLRAKGAPGSYLVQSDRPLDDAFYSRLKKDGAQFVSFIPNQAALVRATADEAQALTNDTFFQAVVPYEPYYKLDSSLLPSAVEQQPLETAVSVTVFPGQRDVALAALNGLGAQLMGEDTTPFGPSLIVTAPPDSLSSIAQLPMAQEIERYTSRRPLNDLSRVQLGISADTLIGTSNYLNLSGKGVTVDLNDTGVDGTHPDFAGRLYGDMTDNDGHGTHVAGIIAGSGAESRTVPGPVPGSLPGADYRGKATNALLFVQNLNLILGPNLSDSALVLTAATNIGNTNLISNNSWGYGDTVYDMHAATFDAATRDAQPSVPGEQPMLFVFAAGNNGPNADTITSPGTAKNVITVGASDQPRFITNDVDYTSTALDSTNGSPVFFDDTDNSNAVASFSSCGNVDLGVEGTYGRFKPDVVAPGVFVASCRSSSYMVPTNESIITYYPFTNQTVLPGTTNYYNYFYIPPDTFQVILQVVSNSLSPNPFPNMTLLGDPTYPPVDVVGTNVVILSNQVTAAAGGLFYFGVTPAAPTVQPVNYDFYIYLIETNYLGNYYEVISNLDNGLTNYYRFESGTSMAAGAVSGTLALMQEYLQTRLNPPITNPSPALLKAMLINGSRSLDYTLDFDNQPSGANQQGWGIPNISNSVPSSLGGPNPSAVLINQSTNHALATGQSQSYSVTCSDPNAPIRVTLVWTDPPGNPAAGVALVNNLGLLVTDKTGTNFWVGNDFLTGDIFTEMQSVTNSSLFPAALANIQYDTINNVQNVYINPANLPIQFPLTVTVLGNHVNVNAVTTETNLIAQDYALVISSDDPALSSGVAVTTNAITPPTAPTTGDELVTVASNGVPLLHERVGANQPSIYTNTFTGTNGDLSGWHFFIFTNNVTGTNTLTNGVTGLANVAFATFLPPNLSVPRVTGSADIDMYVARSTVIPNYYDLTNLNPTVIQETDKSLSRSGTETIIYTNSPTNEVFCIGIKSEDQQGSDFGFYGVAQVGPFSTQNPDGSVTATGTSLPVPIPDTSTQGALVFAFLFSPNNPGMVVRKVEITAGLQHQNADALYGTVQHNGVTSVINNYSGNPAGFTNAYDDLPDNSTSGSIPTDSPGSLKNFVGQSAQGLWQLTETDYAPFLVGEVTEFTVTAYPQPPGNDFTITIPAQSWFYDYVDVPNDATNMFISVIYQSTNVNGDVGIFITNSDNVGFNDYGVSNIAPPGGYLSYGLTNVPPLAGGTWYYGIYNYSLSPVTLNVAIEFQESLIPNLIEAFTNSTPTPLATDAHTESQPICINNGDNLVDISVGLVLTDPDLDDLVIHLTSPQGTSILLFEDRGGAGATNLGLFSINTNGGTTNYNYTYTVFTEDTNLTTTPIKFGQPPFASSNYLAGGTISSNSFEGTNAGTYTNGQSIGGGWIVATNQVGIVTDPNTANTNIIPTGTNYLALTSGRITNSFATIAQASYELTYWVRPPQINDWWPGDDSTKDIVNTNNGVATNIAYDVGEVARAFTFDGNSVVAFATNNFATNFPTNGQFNTNLANFGTNDFSVDFWVKTSVTNLQALVGKRPLCNDCSMWDLSMNTNGTIRYVLCQDTIGTDYTDINSQAKINDGIYHEVTAERQGTRIALFVDGKLDTAVTNGIAGISNNVSMTLGTNACVGPAGDGTEQVIGDLDEVDIWNRAISPAEVEAIYEAQSFGKYSTNSLFPNFQVVVDGISTNTIILTNFTGGWTKFTNSFTSTNTNAVIEIVGNTLSTLFDDISIIQLPVTNYDNYFQPEEPLSSLIGQDPTGCWTLDIQDTRQDSSAANNGELLSWSLQTTISSTNAHIIVLTNGIALSVTNATNTTYFAVDVPLTANFATNMLYNISGSPVDLLFNQQLLPTGSLPGDYQLLPFALTDGTNTLSTQGAPPALVPGRRYYLGVQDSTAVPSTFTIDVQFDVGNNTNLVTLTNGQALATNIITTNGAEFYVFPNVPTNATMVTFQLLGPTNGEVDLYAREGLPVPGPLSFDFQSRNMGTNDQFIVVTTNSEPVSLPVTTTNDILPLSPTTWYLSVYTFGQVTNGTNIVATNDYTIIATWVTNGPGTPDGLTVIPLANEIPYTNTAFPGFPTNVLYSFDVNQPTNPPAGLEFVVSNYTGAGNLELLAADGTFPTPSAFYSGSFYPGTSDQTIVIGTNSQTTNFNGTWYLAVPNTTSTNIPYTITAIILTNAMAINPSPEIQFLGASISSPNSGFTFYWSAVPGTTYAVQVTTNLLVWSTVTNVTATSTVESYTDSTPVKNQPARFFRVETP